MPVKYLSTLVAAAVLGLSSQQTLANDVDKLPDLVRNGNFAEAFELGQKLEDIEAGVPTFDFFYGLAALETGNLREAVFALERVVMVEPEFHRARLELARAYYLQGDLENSRAQFNAVLESDPPDNVKTRIETFLAAIEKREQSVAARFSGFARLSYGYDSNINSAPQGDDVNLVLGNGLTGSLPEESEAQQDNYINTQGALRFQMPLSKTQGLFAHAYLDNKDNWDSDRFDTTLIQLSGGYSQSWGDLYLRLPVSVYRVWLDGENFQTQYSLNAETYYSLTSAGRLIAAAQLATRRFEDVNDQQGADMRDVDIKGLSAGWLHAPRDSSLTWQARVYWSDEEAREDEDTNPNSKQIIGVRFNISAEPLAGHSVFSRGYYQTSDYDQDWMQTDFTAAKREDDTWNLGLGYSYALRQQAALSVEYSYTDNDSTHSLYGYDREQVSLGLQLTF